MTRNTSENMTIGQLARAAGVSVETIRFYQREGLLDLPAKQGGGVRRYAPPALERLQLIRRAKELGLTLQDVRAALEAASARGASCAGLHEIAAVRLAALDHRMQEIERARKLLRLATQRCNGTGPAAECAILAALSGEHRNEPD